MAPGPDTIGHVAASFVNPIRHLCGRYSHTAGHPTGHAPICTGCKTTLGTHSILSDPLRRIQSKKREKLLAPGLLGLPS